MITEVSNSKDGFSHLVRDALNRLYDMSVLGQHPLLDYLVSGESSPVQRARKLRQILIEQIELLRPSSEIPAQSPDWRAYQILEKRYIEGMDTNEILQEMAISRAQFFRDQARILDILTEQIWDYIQETVQGLSAGKKNVLSHDTQRLINDSQTEELNILELLIELEPIIDAISANKGIICEFGVASPPIKLLLNRVLFRQMILTVLNAISSPEQPISLQFETFKADEESGLLVRSSSQVLRLDSTQIEVASNIAEHLHATIEPREDKSSYELAICWRKRKKRRHLLLVDDNEDIVALLERYLDKNVWQITGATRVYEALSHLQREIPDVIVLDVMMPDTDGWDLLLQLKANSETKNIPVIVCSAVHNRDVAIALGANAYLSKPISADSIHAALAAWLNS